RQLNSGTMPSRPLLKQLNGDWQRLSDKLDDQVRDLSPSSYIESRRLLNQLKDTVKGLGDQRLCKSCHGNWRKTGGTFGELVDYCQKNGLQFGPAVDGDEPSYTAAYYSMRAYERALVGGPGLSTK